MQAHTKVAFIILWLMISPSYLERYACNDNCSILSMVLGLVGVHEPVQDHVVRSGCTNNCLHCYAMGLHRISSVWLQWLFELCVLHIKSVVGVCITSYLLCYTECLIWHTNHQLNINIKLILLYSLSKHNFSQTLSLTQTWKKICLQRNISIF